MRVPELGESAQHPLELSQVLVLLHAEVVRVPPQVVQAAAVRGVPELAEHASDLDRLERRHPARARTEETARGYVDEAVVTRSCGPHDVVRERSVGVEPAGGTSQRR